MERMRVCAGRGEQHRAAPTLLVGLLQGGSIKFTLNSNEHTEENIIVVTLSTRGPRRYTPGCMLYVYPWPPYSNEWKANVLEGAGHLLKPTPEQRLSNHSWATATRHGTPVKLWICKDVEVAWGSKNDTWPLKNLEGCFFLIIFPKLNSKIID